MRKMIRVKEGVRLAALQPPMIDAVQKAANVYKNMGFECMWVTSTDEGVHGYASLHYVGLAVDLGTIGAHGVMDTHEIPFVVSNLVQALGVGYDVVNEHDHIHIEYQPKTGEPRWALR